MTSFNPRPKPSYFLILHLQEPKFYFLLKLIWVQILFIFNQKRSPNLQSYMDSILEGFLEDSRDEDFQLCQLGAYCFSALIVSLICSVESRAGSLQMTFPKILCELSSCQLWPTGGSGRRLERRWREEKTLPASISDYRSRQIRLQPLASFHTPGSSHCQWCHHQQHCSVLVVGALTQGAPP